MTEKFVVTFYKQWLSVLLVPVLGLPLALLALAATKLSANGSGFLLYVGVLASGFWGIFCLIKKWALIPCEISISADALTMENLATSEVQHIPFAGIQAYHLDSRQLVLLLQSGAKTQFQINDKFYKPGSFVEMGRALEQALRAARGHNIVRLE
ncbi:MAG: hypothetical protein EOO56_10595 [Hymenobacter sp.]|nr:MAG: hypothetical protein EOO56_10595 [Hymenobacter sp.]